MSSSHLWCGWMWWFWGQEAGGDKRMNFGGLEDGFISASPRVPLRRISSSLSSLFEAPEKINCVLGFTNNCRKMFEGGTKVQAPPLKLGDFLWECLDLLFCIFLLLLVLLLVLSCPSPLLKQVGHLIVDAVFPIPNVVLQPFLFFWDKPPHVVSPFQPVLFKNFPYRRNSSQRHFLWRPLSNFCYHSSSSLSYASSIICFMLSSSFYSLSAGSPLSAAALMQMCCCGGIPPQQHICICSEFLHLSPPCVHDL